MFRVELDTDDLTSDGAIDFLEHGEMGDHITPKMQLYAGLLIRATRALKNLTQDAENARFEIWLPRTEPSLYPDEWSIIEGVTHGSVDG